MQIHSMAGALFLKASGWKLKGEIPQDLKKAIIICGPHTSNWDAFYSFSAFATKKINVKFLIKKEAMFFPLNILLNFLGALPIDRTKSAQKQVGVIDNIIDMFQKSNTLYLAISPEGTRKYNEIWKKGFYHIATNTNVPLILAYLDYSTKTAGFGPVFYITGDIEKDIKEIKNFYKDKKGKYPENGIR